MKKLTLEEFVKRSNKIHDNFYNYSQSVFTGVMNKIDIICPIHGVFSQRADHHLDGRKCKLCSCNSKKNLLRQKNEKEIFFKKAKKNSQQ